MICQFAGYRPTAVFARGQVAPEAETPDGFEPEPALDGMIIEFSNGVTGLQVGNDGEHGGFYCEVIGSEGRVRAGMYIASYAANQQGKPIDLEQHGLPPNASVFTVAYDQIADYLNGGSLPHCTNDDAVAVFEIGFGAIESIATNQRVVLPNAHRKRRVFANG